MFCSTMEKIVMMKNHHQGERVQKRHIKGETRVQTEIATIVKMGTHQEEIQLFHVEVLLTLKEKAVQNSQEIIDEVAVLPTMLRTTLISRKNYNFRFQEARIHGKAKVRRRLKGGQDEL